MDMCILFRVRVLEIKELTNIFCYDVPCISFSVGKIFQTGKQNNPQLTVSPKVYNLRGSHQENRNDIMINEYVLSVLNFPPRGTDG